MDLIGHTLPTMGCGASHELGGTGSAYWAATEPKVRELSEEELQLLQAKVLRHFTKRQLSAAWGSWMAFHIARRAQLAKERAATRVLAKLRNLPFVQCKCSLLPCYPVHDINRVSAVCGAQPSNNGCGGWMRRNGCGLRQTACVSP